MLPSNDILSYISLLIQNVGFSYLYFLVFVFSLGQREENQATKQARIVVLLCWSASVCSEHLELLD